MDFKVGDIVKTKLYGNSFLIKDIKESDIVFPYVIVSNEPYKARKSNLRMMIDLEKFKKEWYKIK